MCIIETSNTLGACLTMNRTQYNRIVNPLPCEEVVW